MAFHQIQVRTNVEKLINQQKVNQAPLGEMKHQLILGACVSTVAKCQQQTTACVVLNFKRAGLFQNKRFVYLFPQNSANFFYQAKFSM